MSAEYSSVIKKYQEQGMFVPNVVEKIEHPGSKVMEHYMNTRLKQLILQCTAQCNLRCSYCAYSGIYNSNRSHTNQRMNFETAKKAIDFYLANSWATADAVITFYGGEPLLELELVRIL